MRMLCKMDGIVAGHAQEGVTKQTVAGKVPSILQSILSRRKYQVTYGIPMAIPNVIAPSHAKPWRIEPP